jgi:hypothetical protein
VSGPAFELAFAGLRRLRPPKVELHIRMTFTNEHPTRRWGIVPSVASPGASADRILLHTVEVFELTGAGRIDVASFAGEGAFYAIPALPGATLRLASVPVAWWGKLPKAIKLELASASAVIVDGRALEERLGRVLDSDAAAEVDASPLAGQSAVVASIGGGAGARFEVEIQDVRAQLVSLPLSEPSPEQ